MVSFSWSTLLLFCSNQIYVTLTVSDLKSVFDQAWEIQHHQCDQAWEIQHHQCDQIRLVLKFLGSKFSYKCGPNICQTPVFLKNVTFLNKKTDVATFWATFAIQLGYFLFHLVILNAIHCPSWYILPVVLIVQTRSTMTSHTIAVRLRLENISYRDGIF